MQEIDPTLLNDDNVRAALAAQDAGHALPAARAPRCDSTPDRRTLLAATWAAALGQAFPGLDELTELALPTGQALPSRLDISRVHAVRAVTDRLVSVAT